VTDGTSLSERPHGRAFYRGPALPAAARIM
jgi:hypothetical protein